jgi:tol-pal system protein YbgF
MISKNQITAVLISTAFILLVACTPKEPAKPAMTSSRIEQLKMQSRMKALAAEVVKLRDSKDEVDALKASIAAMDSQIAVYQKQLDEKAVEEANRPEAKPIIPAKDPDLINLKGNIYVLNREIDSLKGGMKNLELLNDSLEIQIEQLAVQTHTQVKAAERAEEKTQAVEQSQVEALPIEESPLAIVEEPAMSELPRAQAYTFKSDYRMAYNDALNRYFNREYLESIQEFRPLIDREPEGAYADNAQYWIGECYYSLENYPTAIIEFSKVFSFPENNKSDHALFKIALCYQQLGRHQKASSTMNQFVQDYPYSELVVQAKDFLENNR